VLLLVVELRDHLRGWMSQQVRIQGMIVVVLLSVALEIVTS